MRVMRALQKGTKVSIFCKVKVCLFILTKVQKVHAMPRTSHKAEAVKKMGITSEMELQFSMKMCSTVAWRGFSL